MELKWRQWKRAGWLEEFDSLFVGWGYHDCDGWKIWQY